MTSNIPLKVPKEPINDVKSLNYRKMAFGLDHLCKKIHNLLKTEKKIRKIPN